MTKPPYLVLHSSWLGHALVGRVLVSVVRSGVASALEFSSGHTGPSSQAFTPLQGGWAYCLTSEVPLLRGMPTGPKVFFANAGRVWADFLFYPCIFFTLHLSRARHPIVIKYFVKDFYQHKYSFIPTSRFIQICNFNVIINFFKFLS